MYPIASKTICAFVALGLTAGISAIAIKSTIPSSSTIKHVLGPDEVILFSREGRIEVAPRDDYLAQTSSVGLASTEQYYSNLTKGDYEEPIGNTIGKRCQSHNIFTMNPVERYMTQDVAISGVIHAPPHTSATVNIGPGFWLTNSLGVSIPQSFDIVKEFVSVNLGFVYGKIWTTTYSADYSFNVPPGKYGAIVMNPWATRFSGYMDQGCIGSSERVKFSGESFRPMSYSKMEWVEGIISVCIGDTFPLLRCNGVGTL